MDECEECGSLMINNSIEAYCSKCGLVTDILIEDENEYTNNGEKISRTGPPKTFLNPFVYTQIGDKEWK